MAQDLRIAIYRELPFFKEVCDLLESETDPPVAANETVVSTETEERPMETSIVPTVHELNAVARVEEDRGELTPSTSFKRLPEPGDTPSPTRNKANIKTDINNEASF